MVPICALSQNYPDEIALARQSCFYDVVVIMPRTNISDIVGWRYHGYHGYHWHGMNIFETLLKLLVIIWKRLFRRVKTRFQKGTFSPIIDGLALDFCDLHNVSLGGKVGISCILISDGWLPDWVKRILNHFWRTAGIWYPPKLIRGLFQIYEHRKEGWGMDSTIQFQN